MDLLVGTVLWLWREASSGVEKFPVAESVV